MRNRRHARLWRGVKAELEESERQARQQATNKGVPHSASIALPLIFSPRSASRLTVLLLLRVALAVASMKEQDPDFGSLIGRFSPATAGLSLLGSGNSTDLWVEIQDNGIEIGPLAPFPHLQRRGDLCPAQLDFDPIGRDGDPIDYFLEKAF